MTDDGIEADVKEGHDAIAEVGIESRLWFRAPYGAMGADGGRVYNAVAAAG